MGATLCLLFGRVSSSRRDTGPIDVASPLTSDVAPDVGPFDPSPRVLSPIIPPRPSRFKDGALQKGEF